MSKPGCFCMEEHKWQCDGVEWTVILLYNEVTWGGMSNSCIQSKLEHGHGGVSEQEQVKGT